MNATLSRLFAAFVYPRAASDYVDLVFPLAPTNSERARARIVDVKRETHDVATLVLQPNRSWKGHRAGQYVTLTTEIDGVRRPRCFSIASAEERAGRSIAITVKARPGGAVTPKLVSGEMRGAIVEVSRAMGDFVLPSKMPERLLFISGGSGITPVMSMLRTLIGPRSPAPTAEVTFLHYARSEADVVFRDELARIAERAGPNLRIHVELGRFDPRVLEAHVPDFERWDTWACGPEPFLETVKSVFAAREAEARVRVERFSLGPGASATSAESEVSFVASKRSSRGRGPLLAMAEQAGINPPSGCRIGICRTCVCRKVSGVTRDVRTGALSTDDDVDIQLCISEPVGPVAIDI